jgi:hypothetical protein
VSAGRELLAQRLEFSTGHLAAVLSACVFAPSLLTFWFVSGVIDLSTAFVLGSLAGPGGLTVRLVAYLLLVPTYLLVRATHYLAHPVHRAAVLSGDLPATRPGAHRRRECRVRHAVLPARGRSRLWTRLAVPGVTRVRGSACTDRRDR